jgi:hypothetical protein
MPCGRSHCAGRYPRPAFYFDVPSQSYPRQKGMGNAFFVSPARMPRISDFRAEMSRPINWLVPWLTVIGRSVFSRKVKHGTPRKLVSSCTPLNP